MQLRRHTSDYQSACYQQHGEPQTWAPWAWLRHVTFLKSCGRIPQFSQPCFFLILSERQHLFTLAYFLLKPRWISSPSLLQQQTSLYIFRNWKLLSTSAQPVKISVFPSQLMSLCTEKAIVLMSYILNFAYLLLPPVDPGIIIWLFPDQLRFFSAHPTFPHFCMWYCILVTCVPHFSCLLLSPGLSTSQHLSIKWL